MQKFDIYGNLDDFHSMASWCLKNISRENYKTHLDSRRGKTVNRYILVSVFGANGWKLEWTGPSANEGREVFSLFLLNPDHLVMALLTYKAKEYELVED